MTTGDSEMAQSTKGQWLGIYLGLALATFVFQLWWRSQQCGAIDACLPSYVKALAWSAIWPAYWAVFVPGIV